MESNYTINNYERPSVAVDAVVFGIEPVQTGNARTRDTKKLKLLLVKRGEQPFEGMYSLAGGFLRSDETVEQAASRELEEEAGVTGSKLIGLGVYSKPGRDPRGWIISCAYLSLVRTVELSTASDSDAVSAEWFDFEYTSVSKEKLYLSSSDTALEITVTDGVAHCDDIAFDHSQIIYDAYIRLKEETRNNDIMFDLLPEMFAISDIQALYEIIMCKKESPANFRRKILGKIEETDQYEKAAAHRTSKLYRRRKGELL